MLAENSSLTLMPMIGSLQPVVLLMGAGLYGLVLYWKLKAMWLGLPPGPLRLPLIGNLWYFLFKRSPTLLFSVFSEQNYKDIMSVYLPNFIVVLLSNEMIHEVFVKNGDKVSLRPSPRSGTAIENLTNGGKSMAETDGRWQPLRRLAISVFRDHGAVGKSRTMEDRISTETDYFIQELKENSAQPYDVRSLLSLAVSNVITHVVFGDRFDYSSDQLETLQFTRYFGLITRSSILSIFKYLPGDPLGITAARAQAEAGVNFARHQIGEHRKTLDKEQPRDYIDSFLIEMDKNSGDPDSPFTEENLLGTVMTLYLAGADTTSATLYWALLYLLIYPETQEKIFEEIQRVAGDRELTYKDLQDMDITMSFMHEVLRICIAPGGTPHLTTSDIHVKGYTIPKNTVVMASLLNSCKDDRTFPNGGSFIPERFLDAEGKFQKPDGKKLIPFSIGKRNCLGEQLARKEFFFFLTSTIRNFHLQTGQKEPLTENGWQVVAYEPKPYTIKFIPRC